jgi:hypothetical protein
MPKILGEASRGGHFFFFFFWGGGRGEGVCENGIFEKILLFQSCFHMMFLESVPNSTSFYFIAYPLPKVLHFALGFVFNVFCVHTFKHVLCTWGKPRT